MSPVGAKKRDFSQLERRRMRAARLLNRGLSQAEVARRVKVSRESVRRWAGQIAKHGTAEGLKKAERAGRRPRLSETQLAELKAILLQGPEKAGFPNGLWTLDSAAKNIRERVPVKIATRACV